MVGFESNTLDAAVHNSRRERFRQAPWSNNY